MIRSYSYANGKNKLPFYVNLYVPNTVEEKWLNSAQATYTDKIIKLSVAETLDLIEKHVRHLGRID